jgi:phage regulator Rha-like protein
MFIINNKTAITDSLTLAKQFKIKHKIIKQFIQQNLNQRKLIQFFPTAKIDKNFNKVQYFLIGAKNKKILLLEISKIIMQITNSNHTTHNHPTKKIQP